MNLRDTYNKIAEDWHKDHKSDDWWFEGTDTFISLCKPGGLILDVGCGAGVKAKYLIKRGLKVVGIDFSSKFLEIAKREVSEGEFIEMDMREASSLPQRFDGIFAQASFLHIPKKDVVSVLQGLLKVLKPEGYFYIAVKGQRPGGKEEDVSKENDYGYDYERFFSFYTMKDLENYFKKCELKIVFQNAKTVGKTEWLQIIGEK